MVWHESWKCLRTHRSIINAFPQIVMEYCALGSILDLMERCNCTLEEQQTAYVVREVLNGLAYLHSTMRIHRDIKAGNILVNAKGDVKIG